jgi:hypothetical protein
VSRPSVPLDGVSVHPVALSASPEFLSRAAAPLRRIAADRVALVGFLITRDTFWCRLRTKPSPPAQFRVMRHRSPPHSAAGRRPPPRDARMCSRPPDRDPAD